jgi:hypothetical protein
MEISEVDFKLTQKRKKSPRRSFTKLEQMLDSDEEFKFRAKLKVCISVMKNDNL